MNLDLIWKENIEDILVLSRRLKSRNCPITRSKLDKLFREGGRIESMLNVYISDKALESIDYTFIELSNLLESKNWTQTARNVRKIFKEANVKCTWEHVVPVKDCIDLCIQNSNLDFNEFKSWIENNVKNSWFICIILKTEDFLLRKQKRNINNPWEVYNKSNITVKGLVRKNVINL